MNKRYSILVGLLVTSDVKFILMRHDVINYICLWLPGECSKIDVNLFILVKLCPCLYRTLSFYLHNHSPVNHHHQNYNLLLTGSIHFPYFLPLLLFNLLLESILYLQISTRLSLSLLLTKCIQFYQFFRITSI